MHQEEQSPAPNPHLIEDGRRPFIIAVILAVVMVVLLLVGAVFFLPRDENTATLPALPSYVIYFTPPALMFIFGYMFSALHQQARQIEFLKAHITSIRNILFEQQRKGDQALSSLIESRLEQIIESANQTGGLMAEDQAVQKNDDAREPLRPAPAEAKLATPPLLESKQIPIPLNMVQEEAVSEISIQDFIRVLNFPESEADREGFRVFAAAVRDPSIAKLMRAAEDILTLLSYDGIYVEDILFEPPNLELWRRFAGGEHGKEIFKISEELHHSTLVQVTKRLKSDPVFKDTTEHFLRIFDRTFVSFEKNASDQEILDFANTRTSLAFILLGCATGTFN